MSAFPAGEHESTREHKDLRALLESVISSGSLTAALEGAASGVVVVDEHGALVRANSAATRLLGQDLDALNPRDWERDFRFFAADGTTPLHVSEHPLVRALGGDTVEPVELYVIPPGREEGARLSVAASPLWDATGALRGAAQVFRPLPQTAERSMEQRLHLLIEASGALFSSVDTGGVLPSVLDLARDMVQADAYAIWRAEEAEREWRVVSASGLSDNFRQASALDRVMVSLLDEPLLVEDALADSRVEYRRKVFVAEGIRSILAVPLRLHGKHRGALAFYSRQPRRFEELEVRTAAALANLAAAAIGTSELYEEQARMRARAEESERRSAFLAQATAILASSLDYETTLWQVARLAVPSMADWCSVEIREADGSGRQLALAHPDPAKMARAVELRRKYPPGPDDWYGVQRVLATGNAELVPEITDEMLERVARDAAHLEALRQMSLTSYMCVPMLARNQVLGTIVFVSAESGRRYGPEDLAAAEHLGRRAALSVDNALLYESARRSEARFRRLGEAGVLGIFLGDGERITEANDLFLEMLGYTREDLAAGLRWPEITAPEYAAADARALEQLIGSGACTPYEKEYICKNGTRVPVLIGSVILDAPPAFTWVAFAVDLTGRRRLETRLREAQKLESIGLLAGGVAHDFNNLLTGILGNASLALEDVPKGSPLEPILENVVSAAERAAHLTRQLLAYSGKGRFVIQPVDLSALIHELTPLLEVSLPKRVHLRLNLDEKLPPVQADASQLQQLLMDLILNAAEAIGDSAGSILITTRAEEVGPDYPAGPLTADEFIPGRCVRLEVEDSGCGMDSETMARIFDPFFTTKFTGRGLGLAATLGIVRGHHGDIQVWSKPSQGSRFRVLLPVASELITPAPEASAPAAALEGSGTILLADDEDVVLETGRRALNRYGYRVLVARDGREAVETLRAHAAEVSLVLLDMTMPVMGGDEALGHLRAIRPEVPVVVSTGYSESEAQRRFGSCGPVSFIQKPYSAAQLAEIVKQTMDGSARALGASD